MLFTRGHSLATLTTTLTLPLYAASGVGFPYCITVRSYSDSAAAARAGVTVTIAASVATRAIARRRVVVAVSSSSSTVTAASPASSRRVVVPRARVARALRRVVARVVDRVVARVVARVVDMRRARAIRRTVSRAMSTTRSSPRCARVAPKRAVGARRRAARAAARARGASPWTVVVDRASSRFGSDLLVERVSRDCPNAAFAGALVLTREGAPDAVLSERRDAASEGSSAVGAGGVFDAFATLPATLEGDARRGKKTIGILGLGAGTCAEIMAKRHDDVTMIGWELDPAIVELARRHFAVGDLEREGRLAVVAGDAFEGCARSEIEFDGLIVDCFDENSVVVACLRDKATWAALAARLKPGGRVVANVSTGRGKGAKLDDAIACAQALADATSDEVTIWRAGACSIWNELILSGPEVNWRRVADEYGDFASLTKDWFYFKKPPDAASGAPWLAKTLGVDIDGA